MGNPRDWSTLLYRWLAGCLVVGSGLLVLAIAVGIYLIFRS